MFIPPMPPLGDAYADRRRHFRLRIVERILPTILADINLVPEGTTPWEAAYAVADACLKLDEERHERDRKSY